MKQVRFRGMKQTPFQRYETKASQNDDDDDDDDGGGGSGRAGSSRQKQAAAGRSRQQRAAADSSSSSSSSVWLAESCLLSPASSGERRTMHLIARCRLSLAVGEARTSFWMVPAVMMVDVSRSTVARAATPPRKHLCTRTLAMLRGLLVAVRSPLYGGRAHRGAR